MDAKKLKTLIKGLEADIISETAMLDTYLSTKGVNPKYAPKNLKVAHSKTNAFKKWARDHSDEMRKKEQMKGKILQLQGEEVEQIDELSKDTLKSYQDKAVKTPPSKNGNWVSRISGVARSSEKLKKSNEEVEIEEDTTVLEEILDYMQTEEYEQLDELSKGTLTSYVNKVSDKIDTLSKKSDRYSGRSDDKGRGLYYAVRKNQATKQHAKGVEGAEKRLAKEDVEQLDELAPKTLRSYIRKTYNDPDRSKGAARANEKHGEALSKDLASRKASGKPEHTLGSITSKLKNKEYAFQKEATEADYGGKHQANVLALKAKAEKKPVDMKSLAARMQASYAKDKEKSVKEDIDPLDETWKYHTYHDNDTARAATKAHHSYRDEKGMASGNPARAMGNGKVAYKGEFKGPKPVKPFKEEADQIDESTRKQELSKSARMIKALYKKHKVVKEEMYDHEKDDKQTAVYGKKPKHTKSDDKDSGSEEKLRAAAVLSGGSTLTGQKRDDIEIDPMMRLRPGQPDPTKGKDKATEKADKKKDK